MTRKLYEITAELELLELEMERLLDEGGDLEALTEKVNDLNIERRIKIGNIARLIKSLIRFEEGVCAEIVALRARADRTCKKVDWLKGYLSKFMGEAENFEDSAVRISFRPSIAAIVDDETVLLPEYKKIEYVTKVLLKEIKKDLESGLVVPGARLEKRRHIQVK